MQTIDSALPEWFYEVYDFSSTHKKENGFITASEKLSESQSQTKESFGYQWSRRDLFDQKNAQTQVRSWLVKRFGEPDFLSENNIILDAGCGGGQSALAYFGNKLVENFYIGNDVSSAAKVARERFVEKNLVEKAMFIQSNLNSIPLKKGCVDIIFSEGVLHHTDNAKKSFHNLQNLLKKNGLFVFYVYKKKAPIREFTDDFIRAQLEHLSPEDKFNSLFPLTKLGRALGELNISINVEEAINYLGIPKGEIDIQRLFFYYIFKCFYKSDWSLEQMNLTNFDWFSPKNCSRHTKEEVREWFVSDELDYKFEIQREFEDDSGLSYIVKKL